MRAEDVIEQLGLAPHPEGGFYREVFRDAATVAHPVHGAPRAAVTSIYFLLPAGTFSALHRVAQTEIWLHLAGDPVDLHVFEQQTHTVVPLGANFAAGQRPQYVVPAHAWQAAVPRGAAWSLCGCTVAPGFDFADFEMPARQVMLRELPAHSALVMQLTRAAYGPLPPSSPRTSAAARAPGAAHFGEVDVVMPTVGEMKTGVVTRVAVGVGARVTPGEVLVEIETDKANVEVPAERHARVASTHVAVGETVAVGALLVRLVPEGTR